MSKCRDGIVTRRLCVKSFGLEEMPHNISHTILTERNPVPTSRLSKMIGDIPPLQP